MNILEYTVEEIKDPTGILQGARYEFFLNVEFNEDDELAEQQGLQLKVLLSVDGENTRVLNYNFYDSIDNKYLDYELEEEEYIYIQDFCQKHYHD